MKRLVLASLSLLSILLCSGALSRLLAKTRWGTPERFVASYVCAWYGVDYVSCRTYLTNVSFWMERGYEAEWIRKTGRQPYDEETGAYYPYSYSDVNIDLLYALYEHNLDFQVLHDIVTDPSDAAVTTAILATIDDAAAKHPRGMLHVAALSKKGWEFLVGLLRPEAQEEGDLLAEVDENSLRTLRMYTKRVADDRTDPLSSVAIGLLKQASRKR